MENLQNDIQTLELFIGCEDLAIPTQKTYDSFCVLMIQLKKDGEFEELQRTETISRKAHPQYCTSIEVNYSKSQQETYSPMLRFDIYERKTFDTERLRDHEYRGTARARITDLIHAKGNQLTLLLHHPRESKHSGTIFIAAEHVDKSNQENESVVQVDVIVSILKKRDWNKTLISQRYEICRAHRHNDEHGQMVWLPVYRSDRVSKQRDSTTWIEFSTASISYRQLCNADEERDMRLVIFGVPQSSASTTSSSSKKSESIIAFSEFTLRFVCEIDPTEEVLALERPEEGVEIGNVSILKAEPTDFGSHFVLRVNHEHTDKYTSVASDDKKGSVNVKKLRIMKLVKKAPLGQVDRSEPNMLTNTLMVNGLFSTDSFASNNSDVGNKEE